jgi:hypothetical protein
MAGMPTGGDTLRERTERSRSNRLRISRQPVAASAVSNSAITPSCMRRRTPLVSANASDSRWSSVSRRARATRVRSNSCWSRTRSAEELSEAAEAARMWESYARKPQTTTHLVAVTPPTAGRGRRSWRSGPSRRTTRTGIWAPSPDRTPCVSNRMPTTWLAAGPAVPVEPPPAGPTASCGRPSAHV